MTLRKSWQCDRTKSGASFACDAEGASPWHSSENTCTFEDDIDDDCEDLHVGWCRFWDSVSGRHYYAHRQSKVVQWEKPSVLESKEASQQSQACFSTGLLDSKQDEPVEQQGAHELPDGWFRMSDPNSGAIYYAHPDSMTSQWEPPSRSNMWHSQCNSLRAIEARGWIRVLDEKSGHFYYAHRETNTVQWEFPFVSENERTASPLQQALESLNADSESTITTDATLMPQSPQAPSPTSFTDPFGEKERRTSLTSRHESDEDTCNLTIQSGLHLGLDEETTHEISTTSSPVDREVSSDFSRPSTTECETHASTISDRAREIPLENIEFKAREHVRQEGNTIATARTPEIHPSDPTLRHVDSLSEEDLSIEHEWGIHSADSQETQSQEGKSKTGMLRATPAFNKADWRLDPSARIDDEEWATMQAEQLHQWSVCSRGEPFIFETAPHFNIPLGDARFEARISSVSTYQDTKPSPKNTSSRETSRYSAWSPRRRYMVVRNRFAQSLRASRQNSRAEDKYAEQAEIVGPAKTHIDYKKATALRNVARRYTS